MLELGIKFSVGSAQAAPQESKDLLIRNWEPRTLGGVF